MRRLGLSSLKRTVMAHTHVEGIPANEAGTSRSYRNYVLFILKFLMLFLGSIMVTELPKTLPEVLFLELVNIFKSNEIA